HMKRRIPAEGGVCADARKRCVVSVALDLENEFPGPPQCKILEARIPECCLSDALFQLGLHPIDDCGIDADSRHQEEVPLLAGLLDGDASHVSADHLA